MEQKDKDLLLKDLCARLPYQVKVSVNGGKEPWTLKGMFEGEHTGMMLILEPSFPSKDVSPQTSNWQLSQCKPYLRPMSSMTEEEKRTLQSFYPMPFGNQYLDLDKEKIELYECDSTMELNLYDSVQMVDFCKKNHLDCYGLIKKGLALSTEIYNPYVED